MRRLVWDASFRRAFKRTTRRPPLLQERILDILAILAENPFEPELKTHKLHGQLEGLWASPCALSPSKPVPGADGHRPGAGSCCRARPSHPASLA